MASTSKAFKMDPRPRYLTPNDTHNLCVFCLGKEHALSALVCRSFQRKRGSRLLPAIRDPPLPRHGGELNHGVRSWDVADELERDHPFSCSSAENESELLDCDDAIFLTSSDSAASALLGYA